MREPATAQATFTPIPTFFIDPLARIFLGILLFVGLLLGRSDLAAFCLVLLLLSTGAKLWRRAGSQRVSCSAQSRALRAFPGEPLTFAVEAVNGSFLPMEIRSRLFGTAKITGEERGTDTRVCRVGPHGRTRFEWTLKAPGRGVYRIGPPVTEAGDVCGLFYRQINHEAPLDLVVYPARVPLRPLPWQARELFGALRAKGLIEDPVSLMGTREYQPGRPARAIHWKASVRLNRLQEKVFEPTRRTKIVLSLDVRGFHETGDAEAFEATLEAAASLAIRLNQDRVSVGMMTNAGFSGNHLPLVPVALRPGHMSILLERMARMNMEPGADLLNVARGLLDRTSGATCIHFACRADEDASAFAGYLHGRRVPVSVVIARHTKEPGPAIAAGGAMVPLDHIREWDGEGP